MKGHFFKRGSKWAFVVDVGRDPKTNKRRQKTRSGFKTKKEAQAACAEIISEYDKGEYIADSKITLPEFMREFIESQIRDRYRPGTVMNYEKALKNHIEPYFKQKPIADITPRHIQHFYDYILNDKNLKPGSLKTINSCLKRTMQTAEEYQVIKKNPVVVSVPQPKTQSDNVWDVDTAMRFLEISKENSYYHLIYLLILFTGLRRGEVLGLPIDAVDYTNNTITIKQQVLYTEKSKPLLTDQLKTKSSYRTISVPDDIMNQLREHIHNMRKLFLENGMQNQHNLVFPSTNGKVLHPNGINKDFRLLIKAKGLPDINLHGLRHTHATILADQKESVHAIQHRLGHSSPTVTNEIYIHLTEKMQQELALNLNEFYTEKIKKSDEC